MAIPTKAYYFFDEAGDPKILGRRGVNLIERGDASKTFIVGYLETEHPREVRAALQTLHERLRNDEYLADIPSMHSTNKAFHANKDCAEVRSEVFRLLKELDIKFYCIVAHKKEEVFRQQFHLKDSELYKFLVSKLLEEHLHTFDEIDCYFSVMGNVVRQDTMQDAINNAITSFWTKHNQANNSTIRILIQQNSEEPLLQAADYLLWAVQRAFEREERRFFNYMKSKIVQIIEIFE